jgi:hypothetical protein
MHLVVLLVADKLYNLMLVVHLVVDLLCDPMVLIQGIFDFLHYWRLYQTDDMVLVLVPAKYAWFDLMLGLWVVTILPPLFSFSVTCPIASFPLPHLVLTIYHLPHLFHPYKPFTKPRTVLLSIFVTFLPTLVYLLTNHLTFLPISSSSYPRMYYT